MSQFDTKALHEFLLHTPEGGLRKVLVDKSPFTDAHFNMLMKIVKTCSGDEFSEHFEKRTYPKVRLGPAETKIKEKFWDDCQAACLSRGILQPMPTVKAA